MQQQTTKKSDLSIAGIEIDPFEGDGLDEPIEPTFADTAYFDPDDDEVDLYQTSATSCDRPRRITIHSGHTLIALCDIGLASHAVPRQARIRERIYREEEKALRAFVAAV